MQADEGFGQDDGRTPAGDEDGGDDSKPGSFMDQVMESIKKLGSGGTSTFSKSLTSPGALAQFYYQDDDGKILPLSIRLQEFRNEYAQTADASLDQYVLDYQMFFGSVGRFEDRRGIGDERADVQKRRPSAKGMTVQGLLEYARNAKGDQMVAIQQLLHASGYMDPDVYSNPTLLQTGVYDVYTQKAWTRLLKDAVMAGDTDVMRTLGRRKEAIDAAGGLDAYYGSMGPERDPFLARLTSEEDIVGMGEATAKQMIGRGGGDFAKGLVGGYNAAETAAQRSEYDAEVTGGAVTAAPSVQGYAEEQLKQTHGTEVGAYAGLGAFNVILQDLGLAG